MRLNFSYLQPRKPDVAYMQHCPECTGAPKISKKFQITVQWNFINSYSCCCCHLLYTIIFTDFFHYIQIFGNVLNQGYSQPDLTEQQIIYNIGNIAS